VEDAVLGACGLALFGCLVWLLLSVTVAATSFAAARLSPGGAVAGRLERVAERTCPAVVRRAVALALGAALSAGAGAAQAVPDGRHHDPRAVLSGLALPDRVTGAGARVVAPAVVLRAQPATGGRGDVAARRATGAPVAGPDSVTVRPGDSLWSIAAGLLGPGASNAEIARTWHRIAVHNGERLGPDPDLILPGTRLSVPDLHTSR
jgi:nucleoid-associated protein YgaU